MAPTLEGVTLVTLIMASSWVQAAPVEFEPDRHYEGGTELQSTALGLSLRLPVACGGQLSSLTEALVLRCEGRDGLLAILSESGVSMEGLSAAMSVPLPLDASTTLLPEASPTIEGQRLYNRYKVLLAPRRAGVGIGLRGENGTGLLLLAAGPQAELAAWEETARALADSAVFSSLAVPAAVPTAAETIAPPAPTASAPVAPQGPLASQIAGKRLRYLYSRSGYTDEWSVDLCSDGRFVYRSATSSFSSGGFSGDASLSSRGGQGGAWQVQGEVLTLSYDSGTVEQAPLERRSDGWYHGTTRYFLVDENDSCR